LQSYSRRFRSQCFRSRPRQLRRFCLFVAAPPWQEPNRGATLVPVHERLFQPELLLLAEVSDMPQSPAPPESIEEAIARVTRFREARGWDKYHTPRHLSRAVSIEASELEEEFLWKNGEDVEEHLRSEEGREAVKDEVGDVLISILLFCERVGIDPLEALGTKLEKTKEKYPIEATQG